MFPCVALAKDKAWQPGPYEGVELMILHTHEITGGLVVLRKFKAGHTIPAHEHPQANEWAYVLSGERENPARFTLQARCSLLQKARVMVRTLRARK
jgi:oxalate decarboxylase/phosphoglucose isomerase-like protein (cupin superfamily)